MRDQRRRLVRPREEDGAALRLEQTERLAGLEYVLHGDGASARDGRERDRDEAAGEEEGKVSPRPILRLEAEHRPDVHGGATERAVDMDDALRRGGRSGGEEDRRGVLRVDERAQRARPGGVEPGARGRERPEIERVLQ